MPRAAPALTVALALVVLVQPAVPLAPLAVAHGAEEGASGDTSSSDTGNEDARLTPNARPITPGAEYVKQRNPEGHGTFVVWEQKGIGRDWDIMAHNFSTGGQSFPLSTRANDELNPTVRGPWVAWERHPSNPNGSVDIVVFDVRTGQTIEIPDSGNDEINPAIGGGPILYYFERDVNRQGHLRAFDLESQTVEHPIGNRTITAGPSAWQDKIAWAEGKRTESKIYVQNTDNGTRTSLPQLWVLEDGPVVGPHGVAWIASITGEQRGTYTVFHNETFTYMRSGVYPHRNLDQCFHGVLWDQPGSSTTDVDNVALWDAFVEKRLTFSPRNTAPTCTDEHLVFEKQVDGEDDLGMLPRVYFFDLSEARLPADAEIELAPGMEHGIYSETVTFQGTVKAGDPREPIEHVWGRIDDGPVRDVVFNRTPEGGTWRMAVDARDYLSGKHTLQIITEDAREMRSRQSFVFYTDVPYNLDRSRLDTNVNVPRTDPSPFPFNIIDHYQAYQPFYNTAFLVLGLLAGAVYLWYRHKYDQPPAKPEYVPPDTG